MIGALALADFRDRVRRPVFLVALLAAVFLGYLAAPPLGAHYTTFAFDADYRGRYDSAYLGTVIAMVSTLWLILIGFYLVKNAVARDRATRVGQVLAAAPMGRAAYTVGKALSNTLVLAAMTAAIAVVTLPMLLLRGEYRSVDLVALWTPFLVITLPVLAVVAALAVLFETVPLLRSGFGNTVWVGVWLVALFLVQPGGRHGADLFGMDALGRSMGADLARLHPGVGAHPRASLGLTVGNGPIARFDWSGHWLTADLLAGRAATLLTAVVIALVSAIWFRWPVAYGAGRGLLARLTGADARTNADRAGGPWWRPATLPRTPVAHGAAFPGLVAGELRVLLRGARWWWYAAAAVLLVAGVFVPATPALYAAWIWPIFIWSRLGAQQDRYGVTGLIASAPTPRLRPLAEWAAGAVIALTIGAGVALRCAVTGDAAGIGVWLAGAVAIPAMALAMGLLSRSQRLFQAVYLLAWYMALNAGPPLDGTVAAALAVAAVPFAVVAVGVREIREINR